jgi:hypothetical protein
MQQSFGGPELRQRRRFFTESQALIDPQGFLRPAFGIPAVLIDGELGIGPEPRVFHNDFPK